MQVRGPKAEEHREGGAITALPVSIHAGLAQDGVATGEPCGEQDGATQKGGGWSGSLKVREENLKPPPNLKKVGTHLKPHM